MVENGSLGEIHAVETTCLDQQDPTGEYLLTRIISKLEQADLSHLLGFFVTFSAQSGGIFVDMGVHDVGCSLHSRLLVEIDSLILTQHSD